MEKQKPIDVKRTGVKLNGISITYSWFDKIKIFLRILIGFPLMLTLGFFGLLLIFLGDLREYKDIAKEHDAYKKAELEKAYLSKLGVPKDDPFLYDAYMHMRARAQEKLKNETGNNR